MTPAAKVVWSLLGIFAAYVVGQLIGLAIDAILL